MPWPCVSVVSMSMLLSIMTGTEINIHMSKWSQRMLPSWQIMTQMTIELRLPPCQIPPKRAYPILFVPKTKPNQAWSLVAWSHLSYMQLQAHMLIPKNYIYMLHIHIIVYILHTRTWRYIYMYAMQKNEQR